ncbi:MAG: hypothetical protein ACLR1T_09760 [Evtepia gabavorous]
MNILRRMEEEVNPDGMCVTFDRKEPTFRHLAYADYKAQRKGMPEELAVQMPVLKEVLDAMNIPCYELAGWEADDLIGTISRRCEAAGWDTPAATGTRTPCSWSRTIPTWNWLPPAWERPPPRRWTPARFRAAYGFAPVQMVDLKALMGDSSTTSPGFRGWGENRPDPAP